MGATVDVGGGQPKDTASCLRRDEGEVVDVTQTFRGTRQR